MRMDDPSTDLDAETSGPSQSDPEVEQLRPCARHLFETFSKSAGGISRRLQGRRTALVVVVTQCPDWAQPARDAAETQIHLRDRGMNWRERHTTHLAGSPERPLTVRKVADALRDASVVVSIEGTSDAVPHFLRTLADTQFVVRPIDGTDMTAILRRRFAAWRGRWPAGYDPVLLDPRWIDLVVERSRSATKAIRDLTDPPDFLLSAPSQPKSTGRPVPPFLALEGFGAAKAWGLELATDLAAYRAGGLAWSDVDTGALLTGPPGTGKTAFAQSLAEHTKCAFIPTSFAQWQASGTGHLGDVTKYLRDLFKEAAEKAPTIMFIDEFDSLPRRGSSGKNSDYWDSIINCLLELMDGAGGRDGIVLIAACNSIDRLDPALLRSGRLDRVFHIRLPDEKALATILGSHLGPDISFDDVASVATALAGTVSGADVVRISREARRHARRAGRSVNATDLVTAALPPDGRPLVLRWRIAIHEAAHAVVAMAKGELPSAVSLIEVAGRGGGVLVDHDFGAQTPADFRRVLIPVLAGRAAEILLLGTPSAGAGGSQDSDLTFATRCLAFLDATAGLGTTLSTSASADRDFVEAELRRLDAEARFLVWRHRSAIEELATEVIERRVIGRPALRAFACRHGLLPPPTEELSEPHPNAR